MKSINFKEVNCTWGGDDYKKLYTYTDKNNDGIVVSCYQLTIWERLKLLFKGELWLSVLTFNKPLQPQYITVYKSDIFGVQSNDACDCEIYKSVGCAHVDGMLCDYPKCNMRHVDPPYDATPFKDNNDNDILKHGINE